MAAATRLHQYLLTSHWRNAVLEGPDPGLRFNSRIGRFLKSYSRALGWKDSYVYAQAQKYWIGANWRLADLGIAPIEDCRDCCLACARRLLNLQTADGYWEYPNPEWAGRIATVEGNYAAIALLETHERTKDAALLEGASRWCDYMVDGIGFQQDGDSLAVNYFATRSSAMIPNNSASAVRVLAHWDKVTGKGKFAALNRKMIGWLQEVQLPSGELPYAVTKAKNRGRTHFLCYQYNAFQFLNLADYFDLSKDKTVIPILEKLTRFVANGVTDSGAARYSCEKRVPEVLYYGAALAAALSRASALGLGDHRDVSNRAYQRLLSRQRDDGGMLYYSRRNYRVFSDRRSYPRYLAMILYLLLDPLCPTARVA